MLNKLRAFILSIDSLIWEKIVFMIVILACLFLLGLRVE
jgi:hypothetical protein